MGVLSFEGEVIGTRQTPRPSDRCVVLSRCWLYSQVKCKITENVAAPPKLPPGSAAATGPGNPCKANTNNKHSTCV